jgi:hypothetical protein
MIDAITLQFIGASDFSSRVIEWFSQGVVAHVDAVLDDGSLLGARSDLVGGAPAGVQIRTPNYENFGIVVRAVLPAPPEMVAKFYELIRAEVGKPYDTEGLLANFVAGRDWRDPGSWWCSELHGAKLEACGYFPTPLATPSNKLTPAGLLLACSARVPIYMPVAA